MKVNVSFGFEYWLIGLFWSHRSRAFYISPFLFCSIRVQLAPKPVKRAAPEPRHVHCGECKHGPEFHVAKNGGYHRGQMGELVPMVIWKCTFRADGECQCKDFSRLEIVK